jgi:integrase
MYYHLFRNPRILKENVLITGIIITYWTAGNTRKPAAAAQVELNPRLIFRTWLSLRSLVTESNILQNICIFPGSPHLKRLEQYGKNLTVGTIEEKRRFIDLIMQNWGKLSVRELTPYRVNTYLIAQNRSGSWKNHSLAVIKAIYQEAQWHNMDITIPSFPRFANNYRKADVFTTEELERLFVPDNFPSYARYLLFFVQITAGLRLGEAGDLRVSQFIFEQNGLVVDGFCKKDCSRTVYNRTGSEESPRLRAVILPTVTNNLIAEYIAENRMKDGKPFRQEYYDKSFFQA